MSCECGNGSDMWLTAEGIHLDVHGLKPPQPMIRILGLIDSGEAGDVLIIHFDVEPIFLYPELDDRGWSHDIVAPSCGDAACEDEVQLRVVRMQ